MRWPRFLSRWLGTSGPSRGVRQARVQPRPRDERTQLLSGPPPVAGPQGTAGAAPVPPPPQPTAPPAAASRPLQPPPPSPNAVPSPPPPAPEATRYVHEAGKSLPEVLAVLIGIEGELAQEVFALGDGETRLGRMPVSSPDSAALALPCSSISREHARVVHAHGQFAIAPLTDRNPTLVNGEITQGRELRDGDRIKLGSTAFVFRTVA